ncbi:protein ANTAGONIST OF LIKE HETEROCHROMATIN PROTEIN 1-like [Ischnura elegans]|uniref:protein ANTAGONIST OF LIKE HETEROCHROMATIN PROTEIN 1-like n=1 Tax=Ischnura elegans TaxID=197161 RepID=UPI001ED867AD|nr:protein ANTAGONIST OF LIKE HETEROCHROMATIN PROTEIN 1-like [Ischnura elegans]
MRMSPETFSYICANVSPKLDNCRKYCNLHINPICSEEQIVVTIRYLATGSSYKTLGFSFRMGDNTVGKIVRNVCKLLWGTFQPKHMPIPTISDFETVARRFEEVWKFPNCIGAIDGKHCKIKCPALSGSMYFNYKKTFSIVLQGVADDHYKFLFVDAGGYGKQSDGGTFKASDLGKLLERKELNIPGEKCLPRSDVKVPHVFIADEAYPLQEYLMKPFSQKTVGEAEDVYNTRLSSARKTIECAFGILYAKWRILSGCIETSPESADQQIKAACILHNIIIDKDGWSPSVSDIPPVPPEANLQPLGRSRNSASNRAKEVRNCFKAYFGNNV